MYRKWIVQRPDMEVAMKRLIMTVILAGALATGAKAEVTLIQVPATCGTLKDVRELLSVKMPNPEAVAKGGDSHGEDVAVLLAGDGYWALVANMSPGRVCVVASGYNWTPVVPGEASAF